MYVHKWQINDEDGDYDLLHLPQIYNANLLFSVAAELILYNMHVFT
jgi:hypothetical protein